MAVFPRWVLKNKTIHLMSTSSQLVYIDSDEEIISVISRLRKISDTNVFFVVPKHALFVRSLVNLRLLERESKKLGKQICLVVQDEAGRALAEKAGLESRSSLEGIPGASVSGKSSLPARLPQVQGDVPPQSSKPRDAFPVVGSEARLHSESIGSSSFFATQESVASAPLERTPERSLVRPAIPLRLPNSTPVPVPQMQRSVPVRDRTPKRLTALNSATLQPSSDRPSTLESSRQQSVPAEPSTPDISGKGPVMSAASPDIASRVSFTFPAPTTPFSPTLQNVSSAVPSAQPLPPASSTPPSPPSSPSTDQSALSRFYRKEEVAASPGVSVSGKLSSREHVGSHSFRRILFGGIALSCLAVIGTVLVIFVPRADVTVLLKESSSSLDAEVTAQADQESVDIQAKRIPLRVVETEKDITQSFPSTGQSSASDKRARGMVTLSNAFSENAQSLVATTRLESSDGKIFRLVKGVTIPGMKEVDGTSLPGTIDAEVVADSSGEEYNIEPTAFTIPGLKGGPKYEKMSAQSSKAFEGGGKGDGAIASVSADDVARAKESALKSLPESLRSELEKDLQPGEKLLDDALLSEVISSGAFPSVGAVASSFDVRMHVSVRALVFSEADVRMVAAALVGADVRPEDVSVEYTVPRPDFTAKSLGIKTHISYAKRNDIDVEAVKQSILGKSIRDVQTIFADYPNIQKIEVVFWPKFMTSRIPSRASQVTIHTEKAAGTE